MAEVEIPTAPAGAGPRGRALWDDVLAKYELEQHEINLLLEMVRTVDQLDALAAIVDVDGLMVPGPGLTSKIHPAVVEGRQLRLALARLSASLRLPAGDEGDQPKHLRRPQRRGGARGSYGVRAVS